MAGIGFKLQKLIEDESFFKKAKAYIFASIITSGPWILSIICMSLIGALSGKILGKGLFSKVSITIVYTFAFSLILTGPIQFVLTRYLADKEYLNQKGKMLSALISAFLISAILAFSISATWYYYIDCSLVYKIVGVFLFVTICSIWTLMDFLSCLKNYTHIILAFFFGSIVSLVAAPIFSKFWNIEGALGGYAFGQVIILVLLIYFITREFSYNGFFNFEFIKYFKLYPFIFFCGLFYNLGLWIDKLLHWYYKGDPIFGNFLAYGVYDTPVFIAYLSIIPSLAYFLIQSETTFFLAHRKFFDSITKEKLQNILTYKDNLVKLLKKSLLTLFIIQFVASFFGFVFASIIGGWFDLEMKAVEVLRILFFAAGAQVMFLYIIIFLMYFDLSKTSFYMVSLFMVLNFLLNFIGLTYDFIPTGYGYLLSIGISFIVGVTMLLISVSDIEYKIFMKQDN